MENGKVLHGSHDGISVLRFVGDIRYTLTPSIDQFVKQLFAEGTPRGFVIDLTETSSIDSTNLGLIAKIANYMRQSAEQQVTIISNRDDINDTLTAMGFERVFNIVKDGKSLSENGVEVTTAQADKDTMARVILESHRTLMSLSEANKEMFRDVVKALEQETSAKSK